MAKKNNRNTKGKIVTAAWDLFYRQGYENTTVEEIIEESQTSRGSFYHYFDGKDDLLSSLNYLFDDKYAEKHLLDRDRLYYRLLRQIARQGQERGELRDDLPTGEIVKTYALCERALIYDWCICDGAYSLREYGCKMMPVFLVHIRK